MNAPATPEMPVTPPVEPAIARLRLAVLGIGAAVLVVTQTMTGLVWYQTRQVGGVSRARRAQLEQLQGQVQKLSVVVGDLAQLSQERTEWQAIFRSHGIEIKPPPVSSSPSGR